VTLLGALLVVFGAFVLWVELLVRAAAIYVAVLFSPSAWPAWSGRPSPIGAAGWSTPSLRSS